MLKDLLINQAIATLLTLLKSFLSSPKSKAKWKLAILKVFKQIVVVFGDDEEFQYAFKAETEEV